MWSSFPAYLQTPSKAVAGDRGLRSQRHHDMVGPGLALTRPGLQDGTPLAFTETTPGEAPRRDERKDYSGATFLRCIASLRLNVAVC
jgi:hypothetical protein